MIASRHNCILDLFECCFKWFKKQDGCKTCDVWDGKSPCLTQILVYVLFFKNNMTAMPIQN